MRLITGTNKSCGTFITPFIPGKYRPTPIKNDGTRYTWKLNYDPQADNGNGRFEFSIQSNNPKPEAFEGKSFFVTLPAGFKSEGTTFNRFGMMNGMKAGHALTIYFDDLQYNGKTEDFTSDPGWIGSGNRTTFEDRERGGATRLWLQREDELRRRLRGEIGGTLWRSGKYAYYADRVGPLTLDDRLEAHGKVILKVGAPDSDMFIGWFDGAER